jgi:hypothetical protein
MHDCEKAVFIAGAGHSGSTLLGFVLGASSAVFYAGEARKSTFIGDERKPEKKRVCKLCGPSCPIWGNFRLAPGMHLYDELARRTGRPIIVDSTKSREWIDLQSATLMSNGTALAMVLLTRDGRAVVNSRLRKYPSISAREHAARWLEQIRAAEHLAQRFPGRVARLRYEELASRPEPSIRRVVGELGIQFERAMIEPWTTEQHPLGGNNGTQFLFARERKTDGTIIELTDKTRAHYGDHPRGFMLDLRWKAEMSEQALSDFDAEVGAGNSAYAWNEEAP